MKKIALVLTLCILCFMAGWILHHVYPPSRVPVSVKAVQRWELERRLHLMDTRLSDVALVREEDMGSYSRRLVRFGWQGSTYEAYVLTPHREKNPATILALPGHNGTKEHVVGITPSVYRVNFGLDLVEAGFQVVAPDIPFADNIEVEHRLALNLILAGTSIMAMRVSYVKAFLDYVVSLPEVDVERVGCLGWSMGGGLALYLAAIDARLKAVAVSSYFGTFKGTFMTTSHTVDNYVPGIAEFGDLPDIACLIYPRHLWIQNGSKDIEYPKDAFLEGAQTLRECYRERPDRLVCELVAGGHEFRGKGIEEWFKNRL